MDERPQQRDQPETDTERRRNNIYLVVFAALVIGIGIWLVNALVDARKADECISAGRRNCNPIEVPR
jgi:hypothetical protein